MWTRAARAQAKAERSAARRDEQKKALADFLEVAQAMEREAQERFRGGNVSRDAGTTSDRMWLMQRFVDIIAGTAALRDATYHYAERLSDAVWEEVPGDRDFQKYVGELRFGFLQAARRELGVAEDS